MGEARYLKLYVCVFKVSSLLLVSAMMLLLITLRVCHTLKPWMDFIPTIRELCLIGKFEVVPSKTLNWADDCISANKAHEVI